MTTAPGVITDRRDQRMTTATRLITRGRGQRTTTVTGMTTEEFITIGVQSRGSFRSSILTERSFVGVLE